MSSRPAPVFSPPVHGNRNQAQGRHTLADTDTLETESALETGFSPLSTASVGFTTSPDHPLPHKRASRYIPSSYSVGTGAPSMFSEMSESSFSATPSGPPRRTSQFRRALEEVVAEYRNGLQLSAVSRGANHPTPLPYNTSLMYGYSSSQPSWGANSYPQGHGGPHAPAADGFSMRPTLGPDYHRSMGSTGVRHDNTTSHAHPAAPYYYPIHPPPQSWPSHWSDHFTHTRGAVGNDFAGHPDPYKRHAASPLHRRHGNSRSCPRSPDGSYGHVVDRHPARFDGLSSDDEEEALMSSMPPIHTLATDSTAAITTMEPVSLTASASSMSNGESNARRTGNGSKARPDSISHASGHDAEPARDLDGLRGVVAQLVNESLSKLGVSHPSHSNVEEKEHKENLADTVQCSSILSPRLPLETATVPGSGEVPALRYNRLPETISATPSSVLIQGDFEEYMTTADDLEALAVKHLHPEPQAISSVPLRHSQSVHEVAMGGPVHPNPIGSVHSTRLSYTRTMQRGVSNRDTQPIAMKYSNATSVERFQTQNNMTESERRSSTAATQTEEVPVEISSTELREDASPNLKALNPKRDYYAEENQRRNANAIVWADGNDGVSETSDDGYTYRPSVRNTLRKSPNRSNRDDVVRYEGTIHVSLDPNQSSSSRMNLSELYPKRSSKGQNGSNTKGRPTLCAEAGLQMRSPRSSHLSSKSKSVNKVNISALSPLRGRSKANVYNDSREEDTYLSIQVDPSSPRSALQDGLASPRLQSESIGVSTTAKHPVVKRGAHFRGTEAHFSMNRQIEHHSSTSHGEDRLSTSIRHSLEQLGRLRSLVQESNTAMASLNAELNQPDEYSDIVSVEDASNELAESEGSEIPSLRMEDLNPPDIFKQRLYSS